MKSQSRLAVAFLVASIGLLATAVDLTWHGTATAQASDTGQNASKVPDTQKKSEKPATNPDRPKVEGKINSQAKAQEYREKLDQPVTLEFEAGTPLVEALKHINERYGLNIIIDTEAFKADIAQNDVENLPIKIPRLNGVRLRTILRFLCQQVQGDFYIPGDLLMIVPHTRIESGVTLRQPVDVSFNKRPLAEALRELSDMTGVSIVLDAQKQQDPTIELTADFQNVPLESASRVLANMAGMKSITMDNMIYVTAPENAENLLQELGRKKSSPMPQVEKSNPPAKQ
jgi:type II secretory pathway component GspD/PulD (secretin)